MPKPSLTVLSRSLLGALLLSLLPAAAGAVQHEVRIYLDLDDDTVTGCEVPTVDGAFAGAEQVLITTVETSSPPAAGTVTDVALAECIDEVTDTFGPPASFDGLWDVGIDNGVGGRDVVETYAPLLALVIQDPSIVHLGVVVTDELGGEEALLTVDGTPEGAPIVLDLRSILEIPTLGEWGLILLALLLAAASVHLMGRRGTAALGLALLVLATGVAWAAGVLDGQTDDWFPSDQLASNGLVLFGKEAPDQLCFRVDVDLLFNSPPVAEPDAFTTDEDTALAGENVLADNGSGADSDPNSDPITVTAFDAVSTEGAPVTVAGNGDLTYDPTGVTALQALDDGESVEDTFTYTIEDPSGGSDTATVTVTVDGANDAPTAMDDSYETDEDVPLNVPAPGVLVNDDDVDTSDTITAVLDTDVSNGTLVLNGDGSFTYTPGPDFNGVDSFTYHATDGTASSPTVTATITVGPVNDGPNAVDDLFGTDEDTVLNVPDPGVLTNDTDPETDPLTVTAFDATSAEGATVSVNATGGFSYDPTGAPDLQALAAAATVDDTFTYTVEDPGGAFDTATVTVTVTGVDDPPVAVDDAPTVLEDDPGATILVLANDTDVDGGPISVASVTQPDNGSVANNGTDVTYTPDPNYCNDGVTTDDFTYTLAPGGDEGTVQVTVTCVNDPPVADDETVTAACNLEHVVETAPGEDAAATSAIFRTVADNVLVGDGDPVEGTAVAIVEAEGTTTDSAGPTFDIITNEGGTVTLHLDGSFTYTPEGGDRSVADSFTYTIQDEDGGQDTATVTLNVGSTCIFFVDNSTGADDTGTGTSSDPFTSLVDELGPDALPDDAEDASQPGDVIYVFEGDSRTGDPYDGNFNAEANERILGQGVDLVVDLGSGPETLFTGNPANRPMIEGVSAGVGVSVIDVTGVEVAGVELIGGDHSFSASSIAGPFGFDLHDVVASGSSNQAFVIDQNGAFDSTATLTDNTVTSSTGNAIQVEVSAGTLELALEGNTGLTSSANAIDLDGGGGSLYVTSFCGNTVSGDTDGTGIQAIDVIFDADPADADFTGDEVSCGTGTTIGSSANPVDGFGMVLDGVTGDLDLGQLDVFVGVAGGGDETALEVFATGAFNAAAGTGFQLTANGGTVSSIDGPAIDIDPTDLESFVLTDVTSQNSATVGIALDEVSGSFQVTGTTDIDAAALAAIDVRQSSVAATFGTTDVDNTAGTGVSYTSGNTGTLAFSGPLTIDTTSGAGFVADGGGTVTVLDNTSTVTTTTGNGVSVTNSTIGAGGMTFASVSANGAANGIVLTNAGAGAFSAAGGSIVNATSRGVDIDQGTGNVTYGGSISTTAAGRSVEVTDHGGGSTVALSGAIDDNGLGIFLDNNDLAGGSTISFSGGLDLDTGADAAFTATNGGTVNVLSGAVSTTADTTTGTVVNVANTAIGGSGVVFDSVGSTGGANGILLTNVGSGAFTADGGSIAGKTSRGLDVAGGSGNVTVAASISTTASGRSVEVTGHTGGTVLVSGAVTDPGLGIHLDANPGALLNFTGQLDLDTTVNTAFNATNGGSVNVTAAGNDVDTTTGVGVNIVDTTIGGADVEFESVSVNGAPSGIVLDTTGTTGTFTVAGDGTLARNGSGGTIQNTTADGVSLVNANDVTLQQMNITDCGNATAGDDCVESSGGSDHVLSAVTVSNATGTGANEDFGNGWRLTDVTGNNRIDNDSLFTSFPVASTHAVRLRNTNTNGNLTISDSSFTNQGAGNSATFVTAQSFGTSNVAFTVEGTRLGGAGTPSTTAFSGLRGDAVLSALESGASGTMTTIVRDSDFSDAAANGSGSIAATVNQSGATHNVTIEDNVFNNLSTTLAAPVGVITTNIATNGGTLDATIQRNDLDIVQGTRRGIQVVAQPVAGAGIVGALTLDINNNTIDRIPGNFAILVDTDDRIGSSTISIMNNQIGQAAGFLGNVGETADGAFLLRTRGTPAATNTITISNNNIRLNTNLDPANLNDTLGRGVFLDARDDRTSNIDFTGNTIRNDDANSTDPEFFARAQVGNPTLCLNLNGNNVIGSGGANGSGTYELRQVNGTFNVEDLPNVGTNNQGTVTTVGTISNTANCI